MMDKILGWGFTLSATVALFACAYFLLTIIMTMKGGC